MPPKKKKPPSKLDEVQDDQELVDVFSYVELVTDCLDRAEASQKACLGGILKADLALRQSQSDADIHSIVLVRRAELLLIAAKKRYDTSDLPAAHRNPLKSCIEDCERVIGKVSAADPISKGIYEQACSILRGAKEIQRSASSKPVEDRGGGGGGTFQRYDPTKTLFRNVTKINPYLLQDVVNCYKRSKTVCRSCFYKYKYQEPVGANRHCRRCKRTAHPLVLIPASQMCVNLTGAKMLAIPAPPRTLMALENKHKPFQMCKKNDHKLCYDKSASGDTWFAHSIEELVIWTIERHYDVKFNRYIDVYHRDHDPPDHSLFDNQREQTNSNHNSSSTGGQGQRPYEYYAAECTFPSVASIPERLFWDVLNCYKNYKEYCKWCYYEKDERGVVVINRRSNSTMCSNCQQPWESVVVIPSSSLCWNFGNFDELPIAPWPKDKPTRDPFEYCRKKDHYRCFRVYIDNFWYPHSVEEMVIWTVEREKKLTFRQFMQKAIQLPSPISSPRQTPPPTAAPSTSVSIPGSKSPHKQHHSPLQNTSSATAAHSPASSNTTAAIVTPQKKKGPPSPLSLGPQSPPSPSFSSVAAGHSPKPTSPLLKHQQFGSLKGQGSGNKIDSNRTMSGVALPQMAAATLVSTGAAVFVGPGMSKPGKLADITGPADSYEQMGFPFLIPQSNHHMMGPLNILTSPGTLYQPEPSNTNNNLLTFASNGSNNFGPGPYRNVGMLSNVKGIGVGSGINSVAGSGNPVVASVSSRRNYRVASTSANSLKASPSPTSPSPSAATAAGSGSTATSGGGFGQINISTSGGGGGEIISTASTSCIIEATVRSETVTGKALYKFSEVNFKLFSDIPQSLLKEIAKCFKEKKLVCRRCFYGDRSISHLVQPKNKCSSGEHLWSNPVLVIPGCVLCDNEPLFKHGEHVAVPPLPPVAIIKKCEKLNHHKCFAQSLEADQRFAHSVEELVVWMVESEKECSFEQFVATAGLLQVRLSSDTSISSKVSSKVNRNSSQTPTILPQQAGIPKQPSATIALPTQQPAAKAFDSYKSDIKGKQLYDPKKTEFVSIKDIPNDLLIAVAECFHNRLFVCRICFFESHCSKLVSKIETKQAIMCENGHTPWKQIKVVPRCKLCITPADHAPIPPLPKHMKNSNIPFAVCKKSEHQTCYAMSRGTNPWFPHTVEELVIWTVEREKGIDFEDCYKEYLPTYAPAKVANNLDPISPLQTFHRPAVTFQSPTITKTPTTATTRATEPERLPGPGSSGVVHVTNSNSGLPQVPSTYSKPLPYSGFNNALDLANVPQTRMGGGGSTNNPNFIDFPSSLTQPDHYLQSEFGFGPPLQPFGFHSIPSHPMLHAHPTTVGGLEPISVLIPPLTNTTSGNPSGIAAGDSFTDFFPALYTENPLNGNSQEGMSSESGKKSVGDLFNLTAGLDEFEDPQILETSVNQEIGGVGLKNDGSVENTWNQPLTLSSKNNSTNSLTLQANKEGSPFIHISKEANQTIVSEDSINNSPSRHPLGRMDSFGFNTSMNSGVPGFDDSLNMQQVAPTSKGNPNWPNFDQISNAQSLIQTAALINADDDDSNSRDKLNINTESLLQSKSANVKGDQKLKKASPKGRKKKKKGTKSASPSETSSRSGNGAVSVHPPASREGTGEELTNGASAALTEELVGIEEHKPPRSVSYNLSSSSTPTMAGLSSVAGFRSEGHTPPIPTTSEIPVDVSAATISASLQPFADVVTSNKNTILPEISDLHSSTKFENQPPLERGIDDIFDSEIHDDSEFPATFGGIEGRSSLLSSIMAARAKQSDKSMPVHATDDISAFKSSLKFPVFESIKDIEDDSSQENDEAKELTAAPPLQEGSEDIEQHVDSTVVPRDEISETMETAEIEPPQTTPNQPELLAPSTATEPAELDEEPAELDEGPAKLNEEPAKPVLANKRVVMSKEADLERQEEDNIMDSGMTVPTTNAVVEGTDIKPETAYVANSESESVRKPAAPSGGMTLLKESSVDPDPQPMSEEMKQRLAEWDLSGSSDEFDLNIEGEDQALQHVPIEDWGCTLSDEDN